MTNLKVTVIGESGKISYEVVKTKKGAESFGIKVANEAFYGEECKVIVEEV